jgi:hypothetical protein
MGKNGVATCCFAITIPSIMHSISRAQWNTHSMKAEWAIMQKHMIQRRAGFLTALRSSALGAPQ